MTTAYLSLGSNLGDRRSHLAQALAQLPPLGIRVTRQSALYETEPLELRDQPWFLNSAAEIETDLSAHDLLRALLSIERAMGRQRLEPSGPRIIDLDILLFGDRILHQPGLAIPHPRMALRRFVLVPLAEIAPHAHHPLLHKSAAQLLAETSDASIVRKFQ